MKRLALSAFLHTRRLAIVGVLALAALLLAARALAPFAEGLRGELVSHLGELLGMRVEVGAMTLRLEGWSPRLTLTDVRLSDRFSDQAELSARELRLDLDMTATLGARRLRIDGLTLVGADLELKRDTQGQLLISGLQALGGGRDPGALAFFLREGHFALTDSRLSWTDSFAAATTMAVDIEALLVINRDDRHLIKLDARLATDASTRLSARGRLRGATADLGGWSGELYTRFERRSDLAHLLDQLPLLRRQLPADIQFSLTGLRLESWSRFAAGQPVEVTTQLRADELGAARGSAGGTIGGTTGGAGSPKADALRLSGLSALAQWSRDGAVSRLRLADLRAHELGVDPLSASLTLGPEQGAPAPSSQQLLGGFGDIKLQILRRLARLAVPEAMVQLPPNLRQGPLAGHLERLVFALDLPAEESLRPSQWRVKAALSGLGIAQQGAWPGAQGLDVEVDALPEQGFVRLSSRGGVLDLQPQLAAPIPLLGLVAEAGWRIEPGGSLYLQWPGAWLQTPDLSAQLRAELHLNRSASPFVDLHLQLRDADASAVGRYLPVRVLNPPLVAWLKRAVQGGRITRGDFLLRGQMEDFPFDAKQGRFVMDLQISGGRLDYSAPRVGAEPRPRWPALEDLDAGVRIVNRRLDIETRQGRVLNSQLTQGSAVIPNLWQPERILIQARGQGPFTDGRQVLLGTPLEASLGRLARAFEVDGQLGIALELGVPFRRGMSVDYQGELRWENKAGARLSLGEGLEPLVLNDIQGRLGFSNQGVQAQSIGARLGQQPITINVRTQQAQTGTESGSRTQVEVQGQASLKALSEHIASPLWSLVNGDPPWTLEISLSNQGFSSTSAPIDLALSSDLQGVRLNLPAPLGKDTKASLPLRIRTQLAGQGLGELDMQLGQLRARAALSQAAGQSPALRAAALAFNAEPPAPPASRALSLSGRLASLKLGPWLDWWKAHRSLFNQGGPSLSVRSDGIEIGRLGLGVLEFRELTAELLPAEDDGLRVRFKASDNAGVIALPPPGSDAPVGVNLAHWRLESSAAVRLADDPVLDAGVARQQPARQELDPRRLGPLDISIDALEWNQYPLGQFRVLLLPNGAGVDFADLQLSGPLVDAQGQGSWQATDTGGPITTSISLALTSPNAGELLRKLGLYQGLDGSTAEAVARLDWPGDPGAFGLASAVGSLELDFGPGRLLEVKPGMGRMLGFLNIAAIQRRLSLDFSDVIDQGFSFDQARGEFAVADGLARIKQFELLSSTADIRITGITNLVEETLDQRVTVTPKVGSGVVLASAVAGGPLVGAAVLLADTITGGAVDRLSRHQYRVTGPWSKPDIDFLGMSQSAGDADTASEVAVESPPAAALGRERPNAGEARANAGKDHIAKELVNQSNKNPDTEPVNLFLENFP